VTSPITIAVPKGRVNKAIVPLFERAGIDASAMLGDDRKLVRTSADGKLRFLLLKPDDVPTYVEYGAAELGISGKDTLRERGYDLYQPLDLEVGICRLVVAGPANRAIPAVPRVATKYQRAATEHFAARGVQADVIYVQGSVEIAPLVGLADLIVDLVESGATLRDNGLVEKETIASVSSVLVANPSLYKLRYDDIEPFVTKLRAAVEGARK
jgi:ATP phosphoribosyltransferase